MPKPTLSELSAIGDPITSDNFTLEFTSMPVDSIGDLTGLLNKITGGNAGASTPSSCLKIRCKTVTLPDSTISPIDVQLSGHKVSYPGTASISGNMSVEYLEDASLVVTRVLSGWMERVKSISTQTGHFRGGAGDPKGVPPSSKGYAGTAKLKIYDTSGVTVATYTLAGIWPNQISPFTFDGTGSSAISVTVTFSVDNCFEETGS